MTIQFSKQPIAVLSDGLPKMGSGLVCKLVCARDDPGKERIRMWCSTSMTSTRRASELQFGPRPDNSETLPSCGNWHENTASPQRAETGRSEAP